MDQRSTFITIRAAGIQKQTANIGQCGKVQSAVRLQNEERNGKKKAPTDQSGERPMGAMGLG